MYSPVFVGINAEIAGWRFTRFIHNSALYPLNYAGPGPGASSRFKAV